MSDEVPFQCIGKDAFKSPSLAAKVAKRMSRRDRQMHSFRCDHCRFWHVGSGNGARVSWDTGKRIKDQKRGPKRKSYEDWKNGR